MGWSSTISVKDSIRWCLRKSVQIKNTWVRATENCIGVVRHGDLSEDTDAQLSKVEDNGEEECKSETSITKLGRQTREKWNRSSGQKSKGIEWRWRRKRYLLPVEKKKANVRKENNAVSRMRVTIVHKNQNVSRHTFCAILLTRSKCVEEEKYPWQK